MQKPFRQAAMSDTPMHQSAGFATSLDGHEYKFECLTSTRQMAAIEKDWKQLEQTCAQPYIYFQSFDWCYTWCVEMEKSTPEVSPLNIRVFTLWRDGKLVFIMPMMITGSAPGIRCLTFLSEPHGQYGNAICEREKLPPEIGPQIWKQLKSTPDVDVITINQFPSSSYLATLVGDEGDAENAVKYASVLDLDSFESWEDYQASLPSKTRKSRRKVRTKMEKKGPVTFEVHYGGTDEYAKYVALALEFKQVWLHETGRRAAVLSQDFTKRYLCGLSGHPPRDNAHAYGAVLTALMVDGKPAGLEIGFCLEGHYYSYLGAFDWQIRNLSPGKLQMEMTQEWAKSAGIKKFDLLGDPAGYKSDWVSSEIQLESRSISLGMRGYMYSALWKAKLRPAIRKTFNAMDSRKRANLLKLFRKPNK